MQCNSTAGMELENSLWFSSKFSLACQKWMPLVNITSPGSLLCIVKPLLNIHVPTRHSKPWSSHEHKGDQGIALTKDLWNARFYNRRALIHIKIQIHLTTHKAQIIRLQLSSICSPSLSMKGARIDSFCCVFEGRWQDAYRTVTKKTLKT